MAERINVSNTAFAAGNAISAGVDAAISSLRYDRAVAKQRAALAVIHDELLRRARSRVALANLRIRMGM